MALQISTSVLTKNPFFQWGVFLKASRPKAKKRRRSQRCTEGWKGENVVVVRVRVYK